MGNVTSFLVERVSTVLSSLFKKTGKHCIAEIPAWEEMVQGTALEARRPHTTQGNASEARSLPPTGDSRARGTSHTSDNFMDKFTGEIIPGAAFASSKNDPLYRHRIQQVTSTVGRILRFLFNRDNNKSMLWLVGPVGAGKSTVLRTLAETSSAPEFTLVGSLFFSADGRNDGSKAISTLAYQMANKSPDYRVVIQDEFSNNPALLAEALTTQFDKFIVEPFVTHGIRPEGYKNFLVLIDGLNECNCRDTQCLILDLVSSFCIKYPTAPLVWVIASRPEPHITDFLSNNDVVPGYTKEEIKGDVDESHEDIGLFPSPHPRPYGSTQAVQVNNFYNPHNFTMKDPKFYDISYNLADCESLWSLKFLTIQKRTNHITLVMEKFVEKTIPGAAFDSSERDPPPRCQPGTRLATIERILRFLADRENKRRLLWLVGPVGVGKSAIMQTLAEISSAPEFTLGASLFFSVNGRDDGSRAIVTLAYQLVTKSESYRNFIQAQSTKDPTVLDKALTSQFNKFIIEPFVAQGISPEGQKRFLILIDGLDECNSQDTQCTILDLISSFCIEYPAAPLVWVVASRPEPHITRFLSQPSVAPSYVKEEVEVDTDESHEDVERYLRNGLEKVRTKYQALDHFPRWPSEYNFSKLTTAAGGLFAFGKTVVDHIDDPMYANPVSQLDEVLEVIGEVRSQEREGKRHPMAGLDVLYSRIVSKIPPGVLTVTRKLLRCMILPPSNDVKVPSFIFYCNWLGIPTAAAYGALHHLHSVLDIPSVSDAPSKTLEFRHKSFNDYLTDFTRSGMFPNLDDEARELDTQCSMRIFNEVSKAQERGINPYDGILFSWPPPPKEREEHKKNQYNTALQFIIKGLTDRRLPYDRGVLSALRLIDIQFSHRVGLNPVLFSQLAFVIFGKDARSGLEKLNALQEASIGMLKMDQIPDWIAITMTRRSQPDHLAPTCQPCSHKYSHQFYLNRSTDDPASEYCSRDVYLPVPKCLCVSDALRKLEDRKTNSPSDIVTTFTDITGNYGWVYHTFPDSEDPSSTWELIVPHQFKPTVAIA